MPSLAEPKVFDDIVSRLGKLHPQRPRAWGKMTPSEAICHLADAFRTALGEKQASSVETWLQRKVVKYIALRTSLEWPKNVKTRPENDQQIGGTRPVEFEADRAALVDLMRRFAAPDARYAAHPMWGVLTREEWLIWGYRHMDHHLRQFAV
jgi:hypothetical protein